MFWMGACKIFRYIHYGEGMQDVSDSRFFLKLLAQGTDLLSQKLCHWLYLDQIFITSSLHPFHIISLELVRNIEPETVYSKNSDRATVKISEVHELIVVELATPNHQISQILIFFHTNILAAIF